MLRDIRKASSNLFGKIVMGTVMVVLIVSFAVWGIADIFKGFGQSKLATIGSTEISIEQFRQIYTDRLQQIGRQIGRPLTPEQARAFGVDRQVLQQVVSETALDENARRLGLTKSNAAIAQEIHQDPTFRGPGGTFDPVRFAQIIRQAGYTEPRFVSEQRKLAMRRQITGTIAEGVAPSTTLTEAISRFQNEQRKISYVKLEAAQAGTIDAPTPEVLQSYFEENKPLFRAPEYRKIAIVTATPDEIAKWANVSDEDAKKIFEERKDQFAKPEQREISQIVLPNAAEAAAAREKLAAGTSFADLAKERGLDASDVELGLVAKTDIVDKNVANAAFSLPLNEISQPIPGTFGVALVKVTKIEPGTTATYDSVSAQLKREIALERARASVEDIRNKMEDERGGGANIVEAAKKLGLASTTIDAVDRSGRAPDGQQVAGLPQGVDIVGQAFDSDVGVENDPINYHNGYIWTEVLEVTPARDRTFDEVKTQVETRWRDAQIASRLRKKAKAIVEKINGGAKLADEAAAAGVKVETTDAFKRTEQVAGLSEGVVRAAFRTPKDSAASAPGAGSEQIVFQVTDVSVPAFDAASEETKTLKDALKRMMDDEQISAYIRQVETDIGVKINQHAVSQVIGANQ
ncbi:MAG TPA: SurA N-terminal domain-containing protein [Xanthobacteraceae bacterium]|nr:SurA N-terminal domain-containing protein [Xanthobacteraceae bacterium]